MADLFSPQQKDDFTRGCQAASGSRGNSACCMNAALSRHV